MSVEQNNKKKAIEGIRDLIRYLNPDANPEVVENSPKRVVNYFSEMCKGYKTNPKDIFSKSFAVGDCKNFILLDKIDFKSICEHHLLPIIGTVSIGYFPDKEVVGLSKLARLVDAVSCKLQLQERMTNEIGHTLSRFLHNKGVAVFVSATHYCMKIRGVCKRNALMKTFYFDGEFMNDKAKNCFLSQISN